MNSEELFSYLLLYQKEKKELFSPPSYFVFKRMCETTFTNICLFKMRLIDYRTKKSFIVFSSISFFHIFVVRPLGRHWPSNRELVCSTVCSFMQGILYSFVQSLIHPFIFYMRRCNSKRDMHTTDVTCSYVNGKRKRRQLFNGSSS